MSVTRALRPMTRDALSLLKQDAQTARSDPEAAERAIVAALERAPNDFDVILGAYRFYFFNHRYEDALPHCEALLAHAARRLNIAQDWREVTAGDAAFTEPEFAPGLYLQALIAWGYCHVRIGELNEAAEALRHAARLDPGDRFGAGFIVEQLRQRAQEEADEAENATLS